MLMGMTTPAPLVSIRHLHIDFPVPGGRVFTAVSDSSFDIHRGETFALVGESGSGKSVTALAIPQLLSANAQCGPNTSILFDEVEMTRASEHKLRGFRGKKIGMIFQEPLTALNPLHTIERQMAEAIRIHNPTLPRSDVRARLYELLDAVELDKLKDRLGAYPHELSGGQRQRVMIAMAIANNPDLLIADEPTTALDVTVQAEILKLLDTLKRQHNMALLLITHDLSIVEKMADRVAVMQRGQIVEQNTARELFANPTHEYTRQLLNAHPKGHPTDTKNDAAVVLTADHLRVSFPRAKNFWGKPTAFVDAVRGVNVNLRAGHTLGIVGESGSGKTTLALALMRLVPSTGPIVLLGQRIDEIPARALRPLRARLQMVFQDPFGSLSPRMSVGEIVGEGLSVHQPHLKASEREAKIIAALQAVQLDPETRHRYPHEFSGGQRQRISIARALVLQPAVILLDEPTSALDVQVQAQIVELLKQLQRDLGLTYVFISHDLRVVRALAHELIVMKDGDVVEQGPAGPIFAAPQTAYTRQLLDAALNLKAA